MKYRILSKPSYSLLELQLENEEVIAETGAMVYMKNVELKTEMKGGLLGGLKRTLLGGESFFINRFYSKGEGCRKAIKCGIDLSVTIITGLGGKKKSYDNAKNTAKIINQIEPKYTAALTLMPIPNTVLFKKIEKGEFEPLNPIENLIELKWFVEDVNCETIFRCNHASNYLPLKGNLPHDKNKIIKAIEYAIKNPKVLKPEFLRGL